MQGYDFGSDTRMEHINPFANHQINGNDRDAPRLLTHEYSRYRTTFGEYVRVRKKVVRYYIEKPTEVVLSNFRIRLASQFGKVACVWTRSSSTNGVCARSIDIPRAESWRTGYTPCRELLYSSTGKDDIRPECADLSCGICPRGQ